MSFLLDALVFFDCFSRDGGGRLGGVCGLDAGRRGGDRTPSLAACHAQRYGATGQQCENDGLDDFVNLVVFHNVLVFLVVIVDIVFIVVIVFIVFGSSGQLVDWKAGGWTF